MTEEIAEEDQGPAVQEATQPENEVQNEINDKVNQKVSDEVDDQANKEVKDESESPKKTVFARDSMTEPPLTSAPSLQRVMQHFKPYKSSKSVFDIKVETDVQNENVGPCDSLELLLRNTESFRCLAQMMLSSSSLAKNRLFLFPPLEDPGIQEAFDFEEPIPHYDDIGIEKYQNLCKEMNIIAYKRVLNSLSEPTLDLKYYGLNPKQLRAIMETLKTNSFIEKLDLQDNWLELDSVSLLSEMLMENTKLQVVNLQECRIGEEGAATIGEALMSSQFLRELDLSFNSIGDRGLKNLEAGLCENTSLRKLNISHNNLTEDSAEILEKIFLENQNIEDLNLAWNGFYTGPGNRRLFNGFEKSDVLRMLDISWNGIGTTQSVRPITKYIRKSMNLSHLDLSNNRITGPLIRSIRAAVAKSQSITSLKIGSNIYPPSEAHYMASVMAAKPADPLFYLDMDNMYFNKESKPMLTKIKGMGKVISIGGVLSDYEIKGPDVNKLLFERCRYLLQKPKKKKAKRDFGHLVLSLPNDPVAPEEFEKEMKKLKMKKLDKDLVKGLVERFCNKKRQIESEEMKKSYLSYYPDACLPPPKVKKKKGGKGKKGKKDKKNKGEKEVTIEQTGQEEETASMLMPRTGESMMERIASKMATTMDSEQAMAVASQVMRRMSLRPSRSLIEASEDQEEKQVEEEQQLEKEKQLEEEQNATTTVDVAVEEIVVNPEDVQQ